MAFAILTILAAGMLLLLESLAILSTIGEGDSTFWDDRQEEMKKNADRDSDN